MVDSPRSHQCLAQPPYDSPPPALRLRRNGPLPTLVRIFVSHPFPSPRPSLPASFRGVCPLSTAFTPNRSLTPLSTVFTQTDPGWGGYRPAHSDVPTCGCCFAVSVPSVPLWQTPSFQQLAASCFLLRSFFALVPFVFNRLQPLFTKCRGVWVSPGSSGHRRWYLSRLQGASSARTD